MRHKTYRPHPKEFHMLAFVTQAAIAFGVCRVSAPSVTGGFGVLLFAVVFGVISACWSLAFGHD